MKKVKEFDVWKKTERFRKKKVWEVIPTTQLHFTISDNKIYGRQDPESFGKKGFGYRARNITPFIKILHGSKPEEFKKKRRKLRL